MKRSIGWIAAAGAGLTTMAMGSPQASAHPGSAGGLNLRGANATSTGQAGYFVTKAPASAAASDRFTVPALSCASTPKSGVALGSIIFTGSGTTSSETAAGVFAECDGKPGTVPTYFAVAVVNGVIKSATFTPAVGDTVIASVTESTTAAKAVTRDVTKAKGVSLSAAKGATNSFVLDGIDSLVGSTGTQLPVPDFGTEKFSGGKMDGTTVKAAGAIPVDMKTAAGVLQIQTGTLNTTGTAWTETFMHT